MKTVKFPDGRYMRMPDIMAKAIVDAGNGKYSTKGKMKSLLNKVGKLERNRVYVDRISEKYKSFYEDDVKVYCYFIDPHVQKGFGQSRRVVSYKKF